MRKATALSTASRLIEDSLLHNAPWEEVGGKSARYYKIKWRKLVVRARDIVKKKMSRTCLFEQLECSKIHLFRELEQIKSDVPIIRTFHKLE